MLGHHVLSEAPLAAETGPPAQVLSVAPGVASGGTFGAPIVTPGAVSLAPSGIPSSGTFAVPAVTPGIVALAPMGIPSSESVGLAVVAAGTAFIIPQGVPSGEAVPLAAVTPGAVSLAPPGIPSSGTVATPSIAQVLAPPGMSSAQTFGAPALTVGPLTVHPTGLVSPEAFGAPNVGGVALGAPGIPSELVFGLPTLHLPGAIIEDFSVEHTRANQVRVSWYGRLGKEAWVILNGRVAAGPLAFPDAERSFTLRVPGIFRLEVHESDAGVSIRPMGSVLERRPVIHWDRAGGAQEYRIYRKRNPAAQETRIAQPKQIEGQGSFTHRTLRDQRQEGGVWNLYRVAAVNSANEESTGNDFPFFVPGLPKRPRQVSVSGPSSALLVTIEV